mmetsp:Transcript_26230/g.65579  ORF Transcript_26230/g.65579 Transcript_26230/m.65579 type:complete len:158 (-) Transcript_26230:949-1422(-)
MRPAILRSCWVTPSTASMTRSATSQRRMALKARSIMKNTVPKEICFLRHAGCVDEVVAAVGRAFEELDDGVAGGSRDVADDRAVLPEDAVEERAFANDGVADDVDVDSDVDGGVLDEVVDDFHVACDEIEEVAGARAVDARDRGRARRRRMTRVPWR